MWGKIGGVLESNSWIAGIGSFVVGVISALLALWAYQHAKRSQQDLADAVEQRQKLVLHVAELAAQKTADDVSPEEDAIGHSESATPPPAAAEKDLE